MVQNARAWSGRRYKLVPAMLQKWERKHVLLQQDEAPDVKPPPAGIFVPVLGHLRLRARQPEQHGVSFPQEFRSAAEAFSCEAQTQKRRWQRSLAPGAQSTPAAGRDTAVLQTRSVFT